MAIFGLENLEQLRNVQWSAKYLWDVQFPDGPSDFSDWFPATDVAENLWTLETHPFEAGFSTYEIPKGTTLVNISITFVDSVYLAVETWLDHWVNDEILNGGLCISSLEKSVKQLNIAKKTGMGDMVSLHSYWVFPKGAYMFEGASSADPVSGQVEFIAAGTISKENFYV